MPDIPMPQASSVTFLAERRLLHETVIDQLRDLIVQGELAPETKLNERVLAERLGTSRTPLREAIKFLASEGLVELLPNRGAVVAALKPEKMQEVFVVLGALEALAGDLACRNATEADIADIRALHYHMLAHHARGELAQYFRYNQQIHQRIIDCAGNATLAQAWRAMNAHVKRARYLANLSRERWDKAVKEHEDMIDALLKRDGARLQVLLRDHLSNKLVMVMEALQARKTEAAR
ncbi:MAG: GntR family transcriptional regulator [Burkholderiales bacterium]|nr:GntR family transcriptional regulator [Burkholderiales bacterium]MDP2400092.1 GntR family transcriptional regulator [Burkholderiales bacterium]